MNHDQLVARIGALADDRGLLWVYFPRSTMLRGRKGFPDLVLAGPAGVMFAECKTGTVLEAGQRAWRDGLIAAGASWYLWQPADLLTGVIPRELDRLTGPAHPQR